MTRIQAAKTTRNTYRGGMKIILLAFMLAAVVSGAEQIVDDSPQAAINKYGAITLQDKISYYTFTKGGTFTSGPLDLMGGRSLTGTWTLANQTNFTVVAEWGWINGVSVRGDFRTLVFTIPSARKPGASDPPITAKAILGTPTNMINGPLTLQGFTNAPKSGQLDGKPKS